MPLSRRPLALRRATSSGHAAAQLHTAEGMPAADPLLRPLPPLVRTWRKKLNWNMAPKAMSSSVNSTADSTSTASHDSQKAAPQGGGPRGVKRCARRHARRVQLRRNLLQPSLLPRACSASHHHHPCMASRAGHPPDSSMPAVLRARRSPRSRSATTDDSCGAGRQCEQAGSQGLAWPSQPATERLRPCHTLPRQVLRMLRCAQLPSTQLPSAQLPSLTTSAKANRLAANTNPPMTLPTASGEQHDERWVGEHPSSSSCCTTHRRP